MDSMSNFAAQTATPRRATVFSRLGMQESLRGNTASKPPPLPKSSSLLERMHSSRTSTADTEYSKQESSLATGCSPTVYSTTRPTRRKRRLSQATAMASKFGDIREDSKPSLLSRLEGTDELETPNEDLQEPAGMLNIKGSAAGLQLSQDVSPTPSFASDVRYRRGRRHQSLMDRMRTNKEKECV